jgi:hypothetical protein
MGAAVGRRQATRREVEGETLEGHRRRREFQVEPGIPLETRLHADSRQQALLGHGLDDDVVGVQV